MCEQCRNEYLRYFFGQRPPIGNPQGKNKPCLHAFALNWLYAPADADAADAFKSVWAGHKKCKCFAYAVRKNRNPSGGFSHIKRGKNTSGPDKSLFWLPQWPPMVHCLINLIEI